MGYKIVCEWRNNNQVMINTHCYDTSGLDSLPPALDVAEAIKDAWFLLLAPQMASSTSLVRFVKYDLDADPNTPGEVLPVTNLPLNGGASSASMPNAVSVLINHNCTGNAPWRGRTNIGGMEETGMGGGGFFTTPLVNAVQSYADAIREIETAPNQVAKMIIVSGGTANTPKGQFSFVQTSTANPNPAQQRRRRIGRGS